jgi:hypothetical protein
MLDLHDLTDALLTDALVIAPDQLKPAERRSTVLGARNEESDLESRRRLGRVEAPLGSLTQTGEDAQAIGKSPTQ